MTGATPSLPSPRLPFHMPTKLLSAIQLILAVLFCEFAGVLGAVLTATGQSPWYQNLHKPSFNPPPWVFGPVWTALYALMGVALYLVWERRGSSAAGPMALALFFVQLLLNAAWTPVFFGLHALRLSVAVILVLWVAIVVTIVAFRRISPVAAAILIPYLLWVTFASVLNVSILILNF